MMIRRLSGAAATAMAALALGASAAQAVADHGTPRATPACGLQCFQLSSLLLGGSIIQNAYVPGDTGSGGAVGQAVNLKLASNSHPNQDFSGARVGTLANFCGGLIAATSYVCVNYPASYPVFESDWSPFGNESGLCVGIRTADVNGERVTLRHCGVSARTLWVGDLANSTVSDGNLYAPWVNASDPNFSHPLVLTVNTGTASPSDQLTVQRLNLLGGTVVPDGQQFTLRLGPVP